VGGRDPNLAAADIDGDSQLDILIPIALAPPT
jgi:hypothetical protein